VNPVIAVVPSTCVSGAYLVGRVAHRVVARPPALVGSIGAISVWLGGSESMERLGIRVDVSQSGWLRDMHSLRPLLAHEERRAAHPLVDDCHRSFVDRVAPERHMEPESLVASDTEEILWALGVLEKGQVDRPRDRPGSTIPARSPGHSPEARSQPADQSAPAEPEHSALAADRKHGPQRCRRSPRPVAASRRRP